MSRTTRMLTAVAGGLTLIGCTAFDAREPEGPRVLPYQSVRHAGDSEMLYRAGRMFQDRGRYEEAILAYRQALASNPAHAEAHNGLAVAYSLSGKAALAEAEFRAAIALAPEASHLHNNLGYFLMHEGRAPEALAELERARELDPSSPVVAANIASAPQVAQADTASAAGAEILAMLDALAPPNGAPPQPPPELLALHGSAMIQPPVVAASNGATSGNGAYGTNGADTTNGATPRVGVVAPIQQPSAAIQPPEVGVVAPMQQPSAAIQPPEVGVVAPMQQPSAAIQPPQVVGMEQPVQQPSAAIQPPGAAPDLPVFSMQPTSSHLRGYRIEFANGNGTTGLARRTSKLLAALGVVSPRLTNHKPYGQAKSVVQYVPGAEWVAREVNAQLPVEIPMTEVARLERNESVRVLLGRDFPVKPPVG